MKIKLSELRTFIRNIIIESNIEKDSNTQEQEIEEIEKKDDDINKDGKNDFTDVMAARMKASGMNKLAAIKKAEKVTKK